MKIWKSSENAVEAAENYILLINDTLMVTRTSAVLFLELIKLFAIINLKHDWILINSFTVSTIKISNTKNVNSSTKTNQFM